MVQLPMSVPAVNHPFIPLSLLCIRSELPLCHYNVLKFITGYCAYLVYVLYL